MKEIASELDHLRPHCRKPQGSIASGSEPWQYGDLVRFAIKQHIVPE
jgi:hypothetical protein